MKKLTPGTHGGVVVEAVRQQLDRKRQRKRRRKPLLQPKGTHKVPNIEENGISYR